MYFKISYYSQFTSQWSECSNDCCHFDMFRFPEHRGIILFTDFFQYFDLQDMLSNIFFLDLPYPDAKCGSGHSCSGAGSPGLRRWLQPGCCSAFGLIPSQIHLTDSHFKPRQISFGFFEHRSFFIIIDAFDWARGFVYSCFIRGKEEK